MRVYLLRNGHLVIAILDHSGNTDASQIADGRFADVDIIDDSHPAYYFWLRHAELASEEIEAALSEAKPKPHSED